MSSNGYATARIHVKPVDTSRQRNARSFPLLPDGLAMLLDQCVATATGCPYPHVQSECVIGIDGDSSQTWESRDGRTGAVIASTTVELT